MYRHFNQNLVVPARDTIHLFDTIRTTVTDTFHVQKFDTLGVVLPQQSSGWLTFVSLFVPLVSTMAGIGAAVAAWQAVSASQRNAEAAKLSAEAALRQVRVAEQQVELQRRQLIQLDERYAEEKRRTAHALAALSRRLRIPLGQFDQSVPSHPQLYKYSCLSADDIQRLEALAAEVHPDASQAASKAAVALRTVLALHDEARAIPLLVGWTPMASDVRNWQGALVYGPQSLTDLEAICDREATHPAAALAGGKI